MTTPDPKKRARAAAAKSVLPTRTAAEEAACQAAAIQLEIEKIELDFKQRIASTKEEFKKLLEEKGATLEGLVSGLNTWAVVNRTKEFGDTKTITLCGHKLQFRDSPGKVTFEKGVNAEAAIQALLNLADDEYADQFLRYTTELNKEAIGEKWDAESEILQRLGIRFNKPEIFTFTPDHEATTPAKVSVPQPEPSTPDASALKEAA